MTVVTEIPRRVDPLGIARTRAVHNLDLALQKPDEALLREHQVSMLSALRDFFASGERAGYLSEPTGVGKSAVMVSAAEAMGLRTVILSPTIQILSQNHREAKKFTPGLNITNYSSQDQDLSGKVINTTYQSVYNLVQDKDSGFDPKEVELVLCDEAHVGLGLKRHEIYRYFPNALLVGLTATPDFTPLEGYVERGIVKEDESWTGLFKNQIHEMTLEEAMEREILVGVDVHMLRTNTVVNDLEIQANQEYRQSDLERFFATKSRSALAIGMIAGVDKIPQNVGISWEQEKELETIHRKIKDKRTVIFGISVAHIEELAKELRKAGVTAAAVHGQMSPDERKRILDAHTKGKTQVVLGVDLLRLGWDSPPTEVSIHLRPTASGVKKMQELGRVLRPSPETWKDQAIAIELVDDVRKKQQQPVLIANIFDPEYVLRGTRTGLEKEREGTTAKRAIPKLSFSGINISAIVEEARSQEMLRKRFKQASVEEIGNLFDQIMAEALQKTDLTLREIFEYATQALPEKTPIEANMIALQAIASPDSNTRKLGIKVMLLLNMKTILTVLRSFEEIGLISDNEENDVLAEAITYFSEKLNRVKSYMPISSQVNGLIKTSIANYISKRDSLPVTFVERSKLPVILEHIEEIQERYGGVIPKVRFEEVSQELSDKTGANPKILKRILQTRTQLLYLSSLVGRDVVLDDDTFESAANAILRETMEGILEGLTSRERQVLLLRFGFEKSDSGPLTHEQIGPYFNVTRERIRQIKAKAFRKLRHPARSRKLKDWIYSVGPSAPKETLEEIFGSEETAKILRDNGIDYVGQLFDKSPRELLADDQTKLDAVRAALSSPLSRLKSMRWALEPSKRFDTDYQAKQEYWENPNSWRLLISVTDHILERYELDQDSFKLQGLTQNDLYYVDKLTKEAAPANPFNMLDIEKELRKKLFIAAYDELLEAVKVPEATEETNSE